MHKKTGMSSTNRVDISFLKEMRKSLGYNQDDFAKVIQTDRSNYAKKELGKVPLSLQEYILIMEFVNKKHTITDPLKGKFSTPEAVDQSKELEKLWDYVKSLQTTVALLGVGIKSLEASDTRIIEGLAKYARSGDKEKLMVG